MIRELFPGVYGHDEAPAEAGARSIHMDEQDSRQPTWFEAAIVFGLVAVLVLALVAVYAFMFTYGI